MDEEGYINIALEEAKKAQDRDEVPIGAVLVHNESGEIIAQNGNRTRELFDPTAHAEILVIREACKKIGAQRIPECDLYVTLEPCAMCAGAISFARIRTLYFGAEDPKGGAIINGAQFFSQKTCHHKMEIETGILEGECGKILKDFFAGKRKKT